MSTGAATPSNFLFGRCISSNDHSQKHNSSQQSVQQGFVPTDLKSMSKSNPQLNSSSIPNDLQPPFDVDGYEDSMFLLRPSENRFDFIINTLAKFTINAITAFNIFSTFMNFHPSCNFSPFVLMRNKMTGYEKGNGAISEGGGAGGSMSSHSTPYSQVSVPSSYDYEDDFTSDDDSDISIVNGNNSKYAHRYYYFVKVIYLHFILK